MLECSFCKKQFFSKRTWKKKPVRYCSKFCIKRKHYLKKRKFKSSMFDKFTYNEYIKTETGKAFFWEAWASRILGAIHVNAIRMNQKYDLDLNGIKIDVKVAELWKRKMKHGKPTINVSGTWCFHSEPWNNSDFFFCIALINNKPIKIYYIPKESMPNRGFTIGRFISKYDKFLYPFTAS